MKSILFAGTISLGTLAAGQAHALLVITSTGVITSGSDTTNLLGAGVNLAGDNYTMVVQYDNLGSNYFSSGGSASDFDNLTGFVTITVAGNTMTTSITNSLGASLSEDAFDLSASNLGFDAVGNFVEATQGLNALSTITNTPDLQSDFNYTLTANDFGSDVYSYNDAAFTQSISFTGTETSLSLTVPEPASIALLAAGLLGIGATARRRRV